MPGASGANGKCDYLAERAGPRVSRRCGRRPAPPGGARSAPRGPRRRLGRPDAALRLGPPRPAAPGRPLARRSPRCWLPGPTRSTSPPPARPRCGKRSRARWPDDAVPATMSSTRRSSTRPCCTRSATRRRCPSIESAGSTGRYNATSVPVDRVGRVDVGRYDATSVPVDRVGRVDVGRYDATSVPVDQLGRVDVGRYDAALRADTALACLISASHEVGTIQPVAEVAAMCSARGIPLLVDAAQTVGRAAIPAGWSLLTASAHKWGGPPGVGVLAVRTGTRFTPTPAGPPDLPAIVAAAVGLQAAVAESVAEDARLRPLIDRIRARVAETDPGRRGRRRSGRPAAAPGDVLVPVRRRRGAADRARPGGVRGVERLELHRRHARAEPRPRRDGRAHPRQRAGVAAPRHDRGRRRAVPRGPPPRSSPTSAPRLASTACSGAFGRCPATKERVCPSIV